MPRPSVIPNVKAALENYLSHGSFDMLYHLVHRNENSEGE